MKIIRYILIFGITIASSMTVLYADIPIASPSSLLPGYPSTDLTSVNISTSGDFIGAIIAWMIGLTAVLTILAITWSGIQMILATGEEEKMKKARHTMIYAFVGLVVAGLAYTIVSLITYLNLDYFL